MNPKRNTLSIILRLLIDNEFPQELRGKLQSIPDGQVYTFENEETLFQLLHQQVTFFLQEEAHEGHLREAEKE